MLVTKSSSHHVVQTSAPTLTPFAITINNKNSKAFFPNNKKHSTVTRCSSPTYRSSTLPKQTSSNLFLHQHPTNQPENSLVERICDNDNRSSTVPQPMTDANYSRNSSQPPRTSSLANLVNKDDSNLPQHKQNHHRHHHHQHHHQQQEQKQQQKPLRQQQQLHNNIDSDDGSQQERNQQRPNSSILNPKRLSLPQDVSRSARNPRDSSPRHPYRKRKLSHRNHLNSNTTPPDLSSLTQKPEDHASSVANLNPPSERMPIPSSTPAEEYTHSKFQNVNHAIEGSTNMLPTPSNVNVEQQSPGKRRKRSSSKERRTELLEENRALRIDLERAKENLSRLEYSNRLQKAELTRKDLLLAKYRAQLVDLFEAADDDVFQINKSKLSPRPVENTQSRKRQESQRRTPGEAMSDSHDDDWYSDSNPSASIAYDHDRSEDLRNISERDPYGRTDTTIRKHRRTRAPAWTAEEEEIFMKAYNQHGCRWKLYQDSLPGRSRRQIQSHGSYLIRQGKLDKKNSRSWQRRKPRVIPSSSMKDPPDVDLEGGEGSERE